MIYDIKNNNYLDLFKETCIYYINKFSKLFNLDISKYKIKIIDGYLQDHRSFCGHDKSDKFRKVLFINPLLCYVESRTPNSDASGYLKESDFIKDLALHEVCHLFNHLVNSNKEFINEGGHDEWFRKIYEPLRKSYTEVPFKIWMMDGVEYTNFSIKEINISGDWIHEFLGNKISELSELLSTTQDNIDELTEMNNLDWELGATINKITPTVLSKLESFCSKNNYLRVDLEDNFIYYNRSQILMRLEDQIFIFKLKGSLLDDATLDLVMSFNKSKLSNFSNRLRKLVEV